MKKWNANEVVHHAATYPFRTPQITRTRCQLKCTVSTHFKIHVNDNKVKISQQSPLLIPPTPSSYPPPPPIESKRIPSMGDR